MPSDPLARFNGRALLIRLAPLRAVEKWHFIQILTSGDGTHRIRAVLSSGVHEIIRMHGSHADDLINAIRHDMTVTSHGESRD
ncbi:hypothetical protein GGE65_006253 [Skermanella aerolata]|uniref:hypothetical protein n=1 Tax=Skermanella aerolata TaxID=393310 RepID=UPI003D216E92